MRTFGFHPTTCAPNALACGFGVLAREANRSSSASFRPFHSSCVAPKHRPARLRCSQLGSSQPGLCHRIGKSIWPITGESTWTGPEFSHLPETKPIWVPISIESMIFNSQWHLHARFRTRALSARLHYCLLPGCPHLFAQCPSHKTFREQVYFPPRVFGPSHEASVLQRCNQHQT